MVIIQDPGVLTNIFLDKFDTRLLKFWTYLCYMILHKQNSKTSGQSENVPSTFAIDAVFILYENHDRQLFGGVNFIKSDDTMHCELFTRLLGVCL